MFNSKAMPGRSGTVTYPSSSGTILGRNISVLSGSTATG